MIKALRKPGTEGKYLKTIKAIYDKPTANIIMMKNRNQFLKVRNETRMPTIHTPIQHSTGIPSQSN
jgi:hypothetical protein